MIGHPREESLLAFQDHRLDDRRRRRLAGHLSGCQRCRNVVQSHRAVRGVFALEAPFAPDGVLERVLASRASGMKMVLPVAEPDARRHTTLPLRSFAIAAGALLAVLAGVQVVPMTPLKQAWRSWSAMVVDWQPLGGRSVLDLRYPDAPIARAATFDPSRIRPMTATYLYTDRPDTPFRLTLTVSRGGGEWVVRELYGPLGGLAVRLDTASLALIGWSQVHFRRPAEPWGSVTSLERHGSAYTFELKWFGEPPANTTRTQPEMRRSGENPVFNNGPTYPDGVTLWVLLGAVPMKLGWAGSVTRLWSGTEPVPSNEYRPVTYLVTGSRRVTTAIGTFDAWEVSELAPANYGDTYWYRKTDGLLLKAMYSRRSGGEEYRIQSVTYP